MSVLSSKKILQEKDSSDSNSITSLSLNHRAISDVSCLSEFKNLERLDLGFNNLTSLEGLKLCLNLKWLSVVQNKLHSLKGVEGLNKLTVLNAGKNKLKSMDEVKSLDSLRALILNDNEITSVCKLDRLKELNTLVGIFLFDSSNHSYAVLSRNPITTLGESLLKLKSITKLSLSNCQLRTVDSSLNSCLELKELRLAHNEIMTIPSEFSILVKLQNLDMGNNLITNWSTLKVLQSLVNLRNLNLQGNPIAEKDNLLKKVKKLLPNLHIFNARPVDKITGKEVNEKANDFSVETDLGSGKKRRKNLQDKEGADSAEKNKITETQSKKKSKSKHDESAAANESDAPNPKLEDTKKLSKHRKVNKSQPFKEAEKKSLGKTEGEKKANTIDSSETPFVDLFVNSVPEINQNTDANSGLVIHHQIKKKKKNRAAVDPAALELSRADEIGLGGPSAWD
ncbi:leucine-rich repeat (LRR) family protein [Striga asiatica]|uniref:Leucine-rich repeat (LRR) family protein n=1 Tax=Striga asiatica TaxID=4170 RepID=A0A5A7PKD0_STRAF|nr:leucine-rich repeat (LRR) family protein [Striga asiatica]